MARTACALPAGRMQCIATVSSSAALTPSRCSSRAGRTCPLPRLQTVYYKAPEDSSQYTNYPMPTPSATTSYAYDPAAYQGTGGYFPPDTYMSWQEVEDCTGCQQSLGVFTKLVNAGRFQYNRCVRRLPGGCGASRRRLGFGLQLALQPGVLPPCCPSPRPACGRNSRPACAGHFLAQGPGGGSWQAVTQARQACPGSPS
jgi:hypothetical protein